MNLLKIDPGSQRAGIFLFSSVENLPSEPSLEHDHVHEQNAAVNDRFLVVVGEEPRNAADANKAALLVEGKRRGALPGADAQDGKTVSVLLGDELDQRARVAFALLGRKGGQVLDFENTPRPRPSRRIRS